MMIREQAVESLLRIDYEGSYSNLETKQVLSSKKIKAEDRRLYLNIVYGCLQNKLYLDYLIAQQSSKPIKKLDKAVSEILRISIYQIYFLDKIPQYAIVNEAVNLTEKIEPRAKGFVNGVLRNIMRKIEAQGKEFNFSLWDNEKEGLSIRYSVPLWIIHKYYESFGKEAAEKIISTLNEKPPFTIRCNTLKTNREELMVALENLGAEPQRGTLSAQAIHLGNLGAFENNIEDHFLYQEGHFGIQDQAAMLVVERLNPKPGEDILDMCAAPGGKTSYLSQCMENKGSIIARDVFSNRLKLIAQGNKRLGCSNVVLCEQDGSLLLKQDEKAFDKILLDAPCSGLGVIRRKPEIRYHNNKEDRKALVKIQAKLLETAFFSLKKGGELLYATCTINKDENENQIQKFLDRHKELSLIPDDHENNFTLTNSLMDGADSFFIAHMKKE